LLQCDFYGLFDLVDTRPSGGAFFGGEFTQTFEQAGEAAFFAQIFCFDLLQFSFIANDSELL
jgi:hypothetical protein